MLSDLMEHAKADYSERLPAQDGDRAGFRESFAAESVVKRSVAPSLEGPSSGHLLPLVNNEPHYLIPRHHLQRNTEQMRIVRLDVCYFLACNRI
jgi:hypothetical protein